MWNKLKEQFNLLKLEKKKLYLITDSTKFLSKELFLDAIASALQGGVDVVELDEKDIPDNVLVDIAKKIRILCDEFGATFIINQRCDIAKIVEADGVHLDESCISPTDAREILGENAVIGVTTRTPEGAVSAFNEGVDYITIGPVYTDEDKIAASIDVNDIKWINENIDIPVFITGEIDLGNISTIVQTGVRRIAITNPIMYAKIPEETARNFLRFLP